MKVKQSLSSQQGTNLAKTLSHWVSERTAPSHDHRGLPISLAHDALALAGTTLSPAPVRFRLALVHRHRHWDHQGDYAGWGIFLQSIQKEKWMEKFKKSE